MIGISVSFALTLALSKGGGGLFQLTFDDADGSEYLLTFDDIDTNEYLMIGAA